MTRVVALSSHLGRDEAAGEWLAQALESLLAQTVPLTGILVVDDASPHAPDAIVARYPRVSLYRNSANTGAFAIYDAVFASVDADAVLLQDSDDWSRPDRLQRLLRDFEAGADMVGSQGMHVAESGQEQDGPDLAPLPADPRAALMAEPTAHAFLLGTALVSVPLARRIGGFSAGLRFSADPEFVRRAVLTGTVRNVGETLYFRRVHAKSLTRAPETGFGSAARREIQALVQAQARRLVESARAGTPLDLTPLRKGTPASLTHVCGPRIPGL